LLFGKPEALLHPYMIIAINCYSRDDALDFQLDIVVLKGKSELGAQVVAVMNFEAKKKKNYN
jgi:hypothetical protein